MSKKRIAILGGGMAGLTAAYELTRTPALRAQHEVTLYQMGWRLGGKVASARDTLGRNLEHGLHVWFGSYNNTFGLVQAIYEERKPPPGSPLAHWRDVVKPQGFTPIGIDTCIGFAFYPINWVGNDEQPGHGGDDKSPAEAFIGLIETLAAGLQGTASLLAATEGAPAQPSAPVRLPRAFLVACSTEALDDCELARAAALFVQSESCTPFTTVDMMDALRLMCKAVLRGTRLSEMPQAVASLLSLCETVQGAHTCELPAVTAGETMPRGWLSLLLLWEQFWIGTAMMHGVVGDLMKHNQPFESLDGQDFREWLIAHRAPPDVVNTSTLVRMVYDTLFQYVDGDTARPSYAAGTAMGVLTRLLGTFKESVMWDIQTGMGEAVVAPLYELLKDRVDFRFFSKVARLELDETGCEIARIHVQRQANMAAGPYRPLFRQILNDQEQTLPCWPSEPLWEQLAHGAEMRRKGVDFESHWCDWPAAGTDVLVQGEDYDVVVMAIAMGAYKPLNDEDVGMCDELIAQDGPFASFVLHTGIVPTQALQLWSKWSLEGLGWQQGKPALVSGPEYLNIWADMSQVLKVEPAFAYERPQSLHYLCGTFATTLYKAPASATDTPALALRALTDQTLDWLDARSRYQWPAAHLASGHFDYDALTSFSAQDAASPRTKLLSQYLRANIDPTECCVLSGKGMTPYRLGPAESGFTNLILAGEATRHGFNTTSIEGAVMSGRAAARAICGEPVRIDYYDFLRRPFRSALPKGEQPYVSWVGHGAVSLAPPASFQDVVTCAFVLDADTAAMQTLVDELLAPMSAGEVAYMVLGSWCMVSFMDMARCTSLTDRMGWLPGRECAFWIPLLALDVSTGKTRLVFWSPYTFIDYAIGMATGREVWGWAKSLGRIGVPARDPGLQLRFTCETTVFETLNTKTRGREETLIDVANAWPFRRVSRDDAAMPEIRAQMLAELFPGEALALAGELLEGRFEAIAGKQVRDSADPDRACYQAVVDVPVRQTHLMAADVLVGGGFELRIRTCESHGIVHDLLGITPSEAETTLPVTWALYMHSDYQILPGQAVPANSVRADPASANSQSAPPCSA